MTTAEMADIRAAVSSMMNEIGIAKSFECGFDIGLSNPAGQSFSLTARFDSPESYRGYATHPSHVEFVDKFIKPHLAENGRKAIQYET